MEENDDCKSTVGGGRCDKFVGLFSEMQSCGHLMPMEPRRGGLFIERGLPPEALAPAGRHDAPTELRAFLGSVIYKYFASTRLMCSVIIHKFVAHPVSGGWCAHYNLSPGRFQQLLRKPTNLVPK